MTKKPKSCKRSLTSNHVIENFKNRGVELSVSEAEEYIDMLYFLAGLVVKQELLSPIGGQVGSSQFGYTYHIP